MQQTYMVIVHFLAEDEIELRVQIFIQLLELRPEDDHYPVLQEVVELDRVGVDGLTIKVMCPASSY